MAGKYEVGAEPPEDVGTDGTTLPEDGRSSARRSTAPDTLALVVVWCADEPSRVGELLILPGVEGGSPRVFGRGAARADDPHPRLHLVRDRPGAVTAVPPLRSSRISRVQLVLCARAGKVEARNVGRCPMSIHRERVSEATLAEGDILQLGAQLILLCVRRAAWLAPVAGFPEMPFGEPDAHGLVGESPAIWALRRSLMFVAPKRQHVLVLGASGTGKELVARAIHALSPRAKSPFVSRNAATLPDSLIDAELFGNAKNYPNSGTGDRPGLVGQAHEGSLFLDEFAELSDASQAHLLRVLDGGEYQRLGEATVRRSDFRLVAATNRDPSVLKHDLLARVALRIQVPDLNARCEDIPLLARHLLRRFGREHADVAERIFSGRAATAEPTVPLELATQLLRRQYTTHIRELEALLWDWLSHDEGCPRTYFTAQSGVRVELGSAPEPDVASSAPPAIAPTFATDGQAVTPSAQEIRACLEQHNGVLELAWRALGLRNRHALARLIMKHDIVVAHRPDLRRRRGRADG